MAASSACTTLPGLARYITPSWTSGVVCCEPASIAHAQTSRSCPTFPRVIWSSGLYPHPSGVRRQFNHSPGAGADNIASVTGRTSATCAVTSSDNPDTNNANATMRQLIIVLLTQYRDSRLRPGLLRRLPLLFRFAQDAFIRFDTAFFGAPTSPGASSLPRSWGRWRSWLGRAKQGYSPRGLGRCQVGVEQTGFGDAQIPAMLSVHRSSRRGALSSCRPERVSLPGRGASALGQQGVGARRPRLGTGGSCRFPGHLDRRQRTIST